MKKLIKNIQFYFGMIIINTLFSIFHILSYSRNWFEEIKETRWNRIQIKKLERKFRILEEAINNGNYGKK